MSIVVVRRYGTGHRRRLHAAIALALLGAAVCCSCASPWPRRTTPPGRPRAAAADDGYLRGLHGRLVDSAGRPVRLVGVSWFGFETGTCALHGLSVRNLQDMMVQMRGAGFNVLRLPFSNQSLDDPGCTPKGIDYRKNPDLRGLRGLALLDKVVDEAARLGLWVILDRHSPAPDVRGDLWYTNQVPESRWISDWQMLARHYLRNRAVIGADLDNEPHGSATWGDGNVSTDWRLAAELAGDAVLAANPHWLIFVQGIQYFRGDQYWWGGQLLGATQYPVRLTHPEKLVYSPHDYGPSVSQQAWFHSSDFPRNLPQIWDRHWGDLVAQGTPVLVGEFSSRSVGQDYEGIWQRSLVSYLNEHGIGSIYWSWNPDSNDTGGMLEQDWTTLNRPELDLVMGSQAPPAHAGASGA